MAGGRGGLEQGAGSAKPTGREARMVEEIDEIDEIARATSDDEPLVLVGHSYGGSVISGVADRLADRVSALVYLDAFVPGTATCVGR